ncbi:histidine phosphatase family protein [Pseudodesulfovibrio cashew]|uniref:phosphoglycerate mutase (2,3-diphosphoglycerate-dependent) n=1 Tax=Pseudodesulfovibrio cashew TaxID=2678688 RepID=A0A6I6J9K8_9BACT|nr:histidine phosphatase family protein [Pseudodesulfovibrio cashew]QGY39486.1 histidine phosphatase family protein [Pseudodesulfovibrio cashew]
MTTFFCLRHGLTDWNRDKRIQGTTNTDLSDEGRTMADSWADSLADNRFDRILTSALARAEQTAAILNGKLGGLPISADARLGEQDWGEWTGLTKAELKQLRAKVDKQEKRGFDFRPPGGESREEVLQRACDALLEFAEAHPDDRVLVVTHNGVLKCLMYALSGLEYLPGEKSPIRPYRVHRIECFENELALGEINMEL